MLNHVLIIPDGNRRFADRHNISYDTIYKLVAVNTTIKLAEILLITKNINELSMFMLSRNNVLKRSKENLQPIFEAQIRAYNKILKNRKLLDAGICFNFIGDTEILPKNYIKSLEQLNKKTKKNNKKICNFLVAYDGAWELIETLKKINESKEEINEFNIYKNLKLKNSIDLIIRSGGEKRLSGCPLIQSSYSEIYFADFFYPQFTVEKLNEILEWYKSRQRRFGK